MSPTDGFKRRIRTLRSLLRRRGRLREDADDLIQEAFLRLHLYCRDGEVRKQDAFLARTVLNLSVDLHRKEHRDLYSEEPPESLLLIDLNPTPDEDFAASQRLTRAGAVLGALSPRTREIFLMHRIEGYSCSQQIAKRFGITVSAVEKHIAKAVLARAEDSGASNRGSPAGSISTWRRTASSGRMCREPSSFHATSPRSSMPAMLLTVGQKRVFPGFGAL